MRGGRSDIDADAEDDDFILAFERATDAGEIDSAFRGFLNWHRFPSGSSPAEAGDP
jgi:hypothetical protein